MSGNAVKFYRTAGGDYRIESPGAAVAAVHFSRRRVPCRRLLLGDSVLHSVLVRRRHWSRARQVLEELGMTLVEIPRPSTKGGPRG